MKSVWYLFYTCVFLDFLQTYIIICQKILRFIVSVCSDINQNALTFRTAASFVEANATTLSIAKDLGLSGFFQEDILINLRTFDSRSLIFYAYDYHNNFVQLHIEDDSQVVFTYNSGNTIHSVATTVKSNYNSRRLVPVRNIHLHDSFRFSIRAVRSDPDWSWTRVHNSTRQHSLQFSPKYRSSSTSSNRSLRSRSLV